MTSDPSENILDKFMESTKIGLIESLITDFFSQFFNKISNFSFRAAS